MKRYYDVYVIILPIKCYHYALTNVNILFPLFQGLGAIPKMKTERFGGQPERPVFPVWVLTGFACCTARKSRSTHAVFCKCSYTCCACSSSNNPLISTLTRTFVLVIIGLRDWNGLEIRLISIGKWWHRRLDYLSAQQSIAVKDAQRGAADSLTALLGCATGYCEITEDIRIWKQTIESCGSMSSLHKAAWTRIKMFVPLNWQPNANYHSTPHSWYSCITSVSQGQKICKYIIHPKDLVKFGRS